MIETTCNRCDKSITEEDTWSLMDHTVFIDSQEYVLCDSCLTEFKQLDKTLQDSRDRELKAFMTMLKTKTVFPRRI